MNRRNYILILMLLLFCRICNAQISSCNISAYDIIYAPDSNLFVLGTSNDSVMLMKLDTNGNLLWEKVYNIGTCFSIIEMNNYLYFTGSTGLSFGQVILYKTDLNGNLIWEKTYGQSEYSGDIGRKIIKTNTNNLIISGNMQDFACENDTPFLLEIDASGNTVWLRQYCEPTAICGTYGTSVCATSDNGYLIIGYSFTTYDQIIAIKTNEYGYILWTKYYSCPIFNYQYCSAHGIAVVRNFDDTYTIAGKQNYQPYLIKINADGTIISSRTFGFNSIGNGAVLSMVESSDSGFILVGGEEYMPYKTSGFILKADPNLDSTFHKIYIHGIGWTLLSGALRAHDNGFFLAGRTNGGYYYGIGPISDVYIVRINPDGDTLWTKNLGCGYTFTYIDQVNDSQNDIIVSPNPFSSELNVNSNSNSNSNNSELLEINIYDITSRKLLEKKFINSISLNMEQFTRGVYIYEIRNNYGMIKKGEIIKE